MIRYIDLSHTIHDEMRVNPLDNDVRLYQDKTLKKDGYNNYTLQSGMHAGTHIDGPMHFSDAPDWISDMEIETFTGRGVLLDVRGETRVTVRKKYEERIEKDDIVLLYTGHGDTFGSEEYYRDHPVLDEKLADLFVEKGIKMLGMDLPSPDKHPFELHKKLLGSKILLLENLANLQALSGITEFEVLALPLKIHAEASPARVVARYVFI